MMMKTICWLFLTLLLLKCVHSKGNESKKTEKSVANAIPTSVVFIHPYKVFRYKFNPKMFVWPNGDFGGISRFSYSYVASLSGLPDMPDWLNYRYSKRHSAGFIYGVPPQAHQVYHLDVVSTNLDTFETGLLKLIINVTISDTAMPAMFNIKIKIDNLNVEDVFDPHRLDNLKDLFKTQFWPQAASDLHLTSIASSLELGYR